VVSRADGGPPDDGRRGAGEADRPLRRRQTEPIDQLGLFVGPQEQVDRRESPS